MTADGSRDSEIKLQGLQNFEFCLEDACHGALTGDMPPQAVQVANEDAQHEADEVAGNSDADEDVEELSQTVKETLLLPTRIYARPLRHILNHYKVKRTVHGLAHITGGGLHENVQRILPAHVDVVIQRDSWPKPAVFSWLQKLGDIDADEMDRVFNMGIGLVMIVSAFYANSVAKMAEDQGFECFEIGGVKSGRGLVHWA